MIVLLVAFSATLAVIPARAKTIITHSAPCPVLCGDRLPAWSPDGRTIAFVHYVRGPHGPRATIATAAVPGGRIRTVVGLDRQQPRTPAGPIGPFGAIAWSPDSSKLAVTSAYGGLFTVPAAGGPLAYGRGSQPSWSPDGRRLAFAVFVDIGGYKSQQFIPTEVRIESADGSGSVALAGSGASVTGGRWSESPAWSTNDEIAYVTGPRLPGTSMPDTTKAEIWVSGPDGSAPRRLVAADGAGYDIVGWTSDGRRLLFIDEEGGSSLQSVDRTGTNRTRLYSLQADDANCCSVSPDGMLLGIFRTEPAGRLVLHVVSLTRGTDARILGGTGLRAPTVAWAPGGARLAVAMAGECSPRFGIYLVTLARRATRLTSRCRTDGTRRADLLRGGAGPDALYGEAGADSLDGGGSGDFLQGGRGDDVVHGGAGNDRLSGGPGRDRLFGDGGDDTIDMRGSEPDVVRCGTGRDTVFADRRDTVARDCEVLYRT